MAESEFVCPRCGATARGERFCGGCGLELAVQYELPTRQAWEQSRSTAATPTASAQRTVSERGQGTAGVPPASGSEADGSASHRSRLVTGLNILVGAAVLAIIASFLPAVSTDGYDSVSYTSWEFNTVADVYGFLVSVAVAVAAVCLLLGRKEKIWTFVLLLLAATHTLNIVGGIQFFADESSTSSTVGGGTVLGMLAGLASVVGLVMFVRNGGSPVRSTPAVSQRSRRGLILLASAGLLLPLVYLLPFDDDVSIWQSNTTTDIAHSALALALSAVCFTRLQGLAFRFHTETVLVLGGLLAYLASSLSIEALASNATQIGVYALLILVSPALVVGAAMVLLDHVDDTAPAEQAPAI